MKEDLLQKVEEMGDDLPANTLDELIDELGGPAMVSEMTGRKGRVVSDEKTGEFRYESRSTDENVSLEMLNCTEKDRYSIHRPELFIKYSIIGQHQILIHDSL